MEIVNQRLSLNEFRHYIKEYYFGAQPANKLVIHHTWKPTKELWTGQQSILALKGYYERKGWKAGPHLFIAEDGIWLFTPMRNNGIHAGILNPRSIGIEVVGNYDAEVWSGNTKINALGAITFLMKQLRLENDDIYFHRDISGKSCPGQAITKEWLFMELSQLDFGPMIPRSFEDLNRNITAPVPVDSTGSSSIVLIPIPDWAKEAVDFVVKHQLFKIASAQDIRDAMKFYRFYQIITDCGPNRGLNKDI